MASEQRKFEIGIKSSSWQKKTKKSNMADIYKSHIGFFALLLSSLLQRKSKKSKCRKCWRNCRDVEIIGPHPDHFSKLSKDYHVKWSTYIGLKCYLQLQKVLLTNGSDPLPSNTPSVEIFHDKLKIKLNEIALQKITYILHSQTLETLTLANVWRLAGEMKE